MFMMAIHRYTIGKTMPTYKSKLIVYIDLYRLRRRCEHKHYTNIYIYNVA